jgi:hypothetical protein
MALVHVTELILAMLRIRIGANQCCSMNISTLTPGAAAELVTKPDGLHWPCDALK